MKKWSALILLVALFNYGCSMMMVSYSPSILMGGTGHVKIGTFEYLPAEKGTVKINEVDTKAGLSAVYTDMPIAVYVADAVSKELKFIGYRLNQNSSLEIAGNILEYSWDYVGFTTYDVTARIEFIVVDNKGGNIKEVYRKIHEGSLSANKMTTIEYNPQLQEGLRRCIKSFLEDAQREKIL